MCFNIMRDLSIYEKEASSDLVLDETEAAEVRKKCM